MTKILSTALLGLSIFASAQVSVSGKANLLFPTSSSKWKDISSSATNAYENVGKNNVGFNFGLSAKVSLPGSFFIMPEAYYTTFKNEYTDPNTNTTLEAKSNRVDVPVLLGYNLLGESLGAFIGPVASYNFAAKNEEYLTSPGRFAEKAKNEFTIGYQFGVQAKVRKLLVNARYEGAFTKDQRDFIENVADSYSTIRYDNRQSLLILGLGYEF
ncbi:outer membrane beta-barrel protein [uncultured Chryseobacterium sp.]|uniref:outer membrane beta-barrel protein n=1 Tax=uncultured Chryseobacterium sp. TaxID=259322 RepID=UPI00260CE03B|nr:outer membrane beta-barrel protein [uncultured Chryseobacterium sp.]